MPTWHLPGCYSVRSARRCDIVDFLSLIRRLFSSVAVRFLMGGTGKAALSVAVQLIHHLRADADTFQAGAVAIAPSRAASLPAQRYLNFGRG